MQISCNNFLRYVSNFESAIAKELVDDKDLQNYYVKIVNNAKSTTSITTTTLKNLYSFSTYYAMNDFVTERYYRDKKYIYYVVSKTNYHKQFNMDSGDRFDVLWPVYVDIFSKNNLANTCSYMTKNYDFLRLIIRKKEYIDLSEEVRITLAKVFQDSDCIINVLEYGTNFAIEYFSVIDGFTDYNAANTFVDIVEQNNQILASDDVYNNTYEKLWNAPLKSRYTKLRKKNGYKK